MNCWVILSNCSIKGYVPFTFHNLLSVRAQDEIEVVFCESCGHSVGEHNQFTADGILLGENIFRGGCNCIVGIIVPDGKCFDIRCDETDRDVPDCLWCLPNGLS